MAVVEAAAERLHTLYADELRRSLRPPVHSKVNARQTRALLRHARAGGPGLCEVPDATTWVWSDLHLGHEDSLTAFDRPFRTPDEMDQTMRTAWYELVGIDDTIICLGDVGVDSSIRVDHQAWWSEAPGAKWLVLGNHDVDRVNQVLPVAVDRAATTLFAPGEPPLLLTHVPLLQVPAGCINVHGRLGGEDLEERLLRDVDEGRFRNICQNALEGLATKNLNLEMLVERRARARERRVVPETIARFLRDAAPLAPLKLDFSGGLPHTFVPGRTPASLRRYEREPDWKLPELAMRYPRCSADRDTAQKHALEWVTPGHPLFEAVRRHAREQALQPLANGATFYSLAHDAPTRIDFYRARAVDGLGHVVHERVFAVELAGDGDPRQCEPGVLGDLSPAFAPDVPPAVAHRPEPVSWLQEHVLVPFLDATRAERLAEGRAGCGSRRALAHGALAAYG